jgi:hypothetical protein
MDNIQSGGGIGQNGENVPGSAAWAGPGAEFVENEDEGLTFCPDDIYYYTKKKTWKLH